MKRIVVVVVCAVWFTWSCGGAPAEPEAVQESAIEGDFARVDGSVIRFHADGRVGIFAGGGTLALGRFLVERPGQLRVTTFDVRDLVWRDEVMSFLVDRGLLSLRPLLRRGPCGHFTGRYTLQREASSRGVWGDRTEQRQELSLELFDDGRAVLGGSMSASGTYEFDENLDVVLHLRAGPSLLRIVHPRYRALKDPATLHRPLDAAERAALPESRPLSRIEVTFGTPLPAATESATVQFVVRDSANVEFVRTSKSFALGSGEALPTLQVPLPDGRGTIEVSVRAMMVPSGAARCYAASVAAQDVPVEGRAMLMALVDAPCP